MSKKIKIQIDLTRSPSPDISTNTHEVDLTPSPPTYTCQSVADLAPSVLPFDYDEASDANATKDSNSVTSIITDSDNDDYYGTDYSENEQIIKPRKKLTRKFDSDGNEDDMIEYGKYNRNWNKEFQDEDVKMDVSDKVGDDVEDNIADTDLEEDFANVDGVENVVKLADEWDDGVDDDHVGYPRHMHPDFIKQDEYEAECENSDEEIEPILIYDEPEAKIRFVCGCRWTPLLGRCLYECIYEDEEDTKWLPREFINDSLIRAYFENMRMNNIVFGGWTRKNKTKILAVTKLRKNQKRALKKIIKSTKKFRGYAKNEIMKC